MEMTRHKNHYAITLLCVVLIIPFLSIADIKNSMPENVYQIWQSLALVIFAILLLTKSETVKLNRSVRLFALYGVIILASSTINNGFSPGIAVVTATAVILFALLQTDFYYEMLSAISIVVVGALFINFPVMLTRINDVEPTFFIGGKNYLGVFLIPGVFIMILNCLEHHEKLTKPVVTAVVFALISILVGGSGTGLIVALCGFFFWRRAQNKRPNKKVYMGTLLTMYALFLVFGEFFFHTSFWESIANFMGKDSTLTARTEIWSTVVELISPSLLIGVGRGTRIYYTDSLGFMYYMEEAHNFVLEILFEGGILALVVFAPLLFRMIRFLNVDNMRHRMVFVVLFVMLINGLTESINNNYLVITILGIACRYATEEENRQREELWERQQKHIQQKNERMQRMRLRRNGQ